VDAVNLSCFASSYAIALALELWHQCRPRPVLRLLSIAFGAVGLLAQTVLLAVQRPALAGQYGWMLFLSWILAIFYLYGTIHHSRLAWAVFVLPLVIGLVSLAWAFQPTAVAKRTDDNIWAPVHGVLLLLASVGMCVSFLASLMYLVQVHRLRTKTLPGQGIKLLSLERLEAMHRRAVILAFPLFTAGMFLGAVMLFSDFNNLNGWFDPRVLSALGLWIVFAVLIALRFAWHLRGRPVALLTIAAFVLMMCCLALSHPSIQVRPANSPGAAP
jgi:ABC-type transport system involved in cytochrome c biogenesis permease subunit